MALVCQAALSRRITESSCHPGVSWSSYLTRYLRNKVITSASVFVYVRAQYNLPSVSRAVNNEILGATYFSVKEPVASDGTHVFLRKRVWFSQLSSTLMTRRPDSSSYSILRAYCYRSTRQRSLLPWIAMVFARRYPIFKSFLITRHISFSLTSMLVVASTITLTYCARSIGLLDFNISDTVSSIASRFYSS